MPAQSTSADKKHYAQEARRQAALKSSRQRQGRPKASANVIPASSSSTSTGQVSLNETVDQGVSSVAENATGGASLSTDIVNSDTVTEALTEEIGSNATDLEVLCEIADSNPIALGSELGTVRQVCRNRRKALSKKGKAAVPKSSTSKSGANAARSMAYAAGVISGRDMAKLRREEMANKGRGDAPAARPSGRVRPNAAPPKVEVGTTLSGQAVTGTQVERSVMLTGNESGSCRAVTGTEYVGTEQFATFCNSQPEANAPKVGVSLTGSGGAVTGTEIGRSEKLTGDESGACFNVTGSEYIGSEKMQGFCGVTPSAKPAKVMSSRTEKKAIRLTGSDESRMNATTGNEAGSQRQITGSQYADVGAAKMTINGPSKVALTHTIAGQPVTGTEVGKSAKITGDEYGGCRPVTGTEYLSNEQFSSVCGTVPVSTPAKVGVDRSLNGQRITGALLDRTEKVTGNEPGSCSKLTGTQYGESKICGSVAPKVNAMQTLSQNGVTGSSLDLSPKMTGDEQSGCLPVTGTEYYGQEHFAQCPSTPQSAPAKVGVEHTLKGEHVSGTMLSAADNVTGNEQGAQLAVSGTPYAGIQLPKGHDACCDACAVRDAAAAMGLHASSQCEGDQAPQSAPVAMQSVQAGYQQVKPQDFSIVSPARAAQITGNGSGDFRVTGPGDMAFERVSGTPEFRYPSTRGMRQVSAPVAAPVAVNSQAEPKPQVVFAHAETAGNDAPSVPSSQRVTGEGRVGGISVTGDNWDRVPGMTGTEGHVAQGRNQTFRSGQMQRPVNNAHFNKEMPRPEVQAAKVTGSSGNTHDVAVITVSGGARG